MTTDEIEVASDALHCGILDHLKLKSSLHAVIALKHADFNFLSKCRGCKINYAAYKAFDQPLIRHLIIPF